jgi:hypothetical protein
MQTLNRTDACTARDWLLAFGLENFSVGIAWSLGFGICQFPAQPSPVTGWASLRSILFWGKTRKTEGNDGNRRFAQNRFVIFASFC